MAGVRFYHPLALILLLWTGAARSENRRTRLGSTTARCWWSIREGIRLRSRAHR